MSERRYVAWGRPVKRSKKSNRWTQVSNPVSLTDAHERAAWEVSRPGYWNYTIVKPQGEKPRLKDREDYCRWLAPAAAERVAK